MTVLTDNWERAELALEGMTCASCAPRIERKLNRLDGVRAEFAWPGLDRGVLAEAMALFAESVTTLVR